MECYVNQLRALGIIHSVLEEQIAASINEQIVGVWDDGLQKLPLLLDDLHFFEPRISSDNTPSIEAALAITKNIRIRSIEQAMEKFKVLSGIVPICMHCKQIRDDKGYWS